MPKGTISGVPDTPIELKRLKVQTIEVSIVGKTPLIAHKWSKKAKAMMLEAQQTGTRAKKAPKDPEQDFNDSRYRLPDGRDGMPAVAFKAAIVDSLRHFDGMTMTQGKQSLYVNGEPSVDGDLLVPITSEPPTMREDMVRVGQGTADLRYRPTYWPWSAVISVDFLAVVLTVDSVVSLVDAAGFGGVGEWRPSSPKGKTGSYGTWEVKS